MQQDVVYRAASSPRRLIVLGNPEYPCGRRTKRWPTKA